MLDLGPMSARYTRANDGAWYPMVPVQLSARGSGETLGLIDTGAPRSIVPLEFAPLLGVELEEPPDNRRLWMIGHEFKFQITKTPMHMGIGGLIVPLDPQFTDCFSHAVVGRDILAAFRLIVDERARTVILDPHPED